jgi:hypothetical protein
VELWRTPERIGRHHPLDEAAHLDHGRGSAGASVIHSGRAAPEPAKALTLPPDDRVGLNIV